MENVVIIKWIKVYTTELKYLVQEKNEMPVF